MKKLIYNQIEKNQKTYIEMAEYIFDHPERGNQEFLAVQLLTDYLLENDFEVEKGIAGLKTAFRASYKQGNGGPVIGLLAEYDALEGIGHACAHHLQGPAIVGADLALKNVLKDFDYTLVIYGTPAEETTSGKIPMLEHGYFKELDLALMIHGNPGTTVDIKSMAMVSYYVSFYGKASHAAVMPEAGRSALDALLLSFQAVEFLREHVSDQVRLHYTVLNAGGPANIVPAEAQGHFYLRSYDSNDLPQIKKRFENIIQGAALMTDTEAKIEIQKELLAKVPVITLNDLIMSNAHEAGAPNIVAPREKTGSSDFGNVMFEIPGSCLRMDLVPLGTSSHSEEYLQAGKGKRAETCLLTGAKILAGTAFDLIVNEENIRMIKEEFAARKAGVQF